MPRSQSQPPASELGELPGFRARVAAQEGETEPHPDELSPSPGPSATSPPPATSSPSQPEELPGDTSRSSTGSIDDDPPPVAISADLATELENFSGGLFELAGLAVNRVARARQKSNTRLWLVTEEEAEDFGAAAGRIAARRIPDELKEGDGADALIIGSVLLGYGMRNVAGVTGPELDQATRPAPPLPDLAAERQAAPPPPAPPATALPPGPGASSRAGGPVVVGVEEATPPPPFSPDL